MPIRPPERRSSGCGPSCRSSSPSRPPQTAVCASRRSDCSTSWPSCASSTRWPSSAQEDLERLKATLERLRPELDAGQDARAELDRVLPELERLRTETAAAGDIQTELERLRAEVDAAAETSTEAERLRARIAEVEDAARDQRRDGRAAGVGADRGRRERDGAGQRPRAATRNRAGRPSPRARRDHRSPASARR